MVNERNELLVTSAGTPARLRNNPNARDRRLYRTGSFMCTEYALAVHDAAEANGLRCALVSVAFEEGIGHALNAFQTTDFGLVFIDCTGAPGGDKEDAYDTLGYLRTGEPYGRLHLDLAVRSPADYRHYADSRAIFRNLTAWDRELSAEYQDIEEAQRGLEAAMAGAKPEDQEGILAAHKALSERVDRYNEDIEYRNELARTFRVQYSENKSPVASWDVFW